MPANTQLDYDALPLIGVPCREAEWIQQNQNTFSWLYDSYPLVESGISLPVSMERLKLFYITDMQERNLDPIQEYLNCYHHLFSYLLGRVSNVIVFKGSNWFQRLVTSIPTAFDRTFQQLTNPFGIPLMVWVAGGLAFFVVLKK